MLVFRYYTFLEILYDSTMKNREHIKDVLKP